MRPQFLSVLFLFVSFSNGASHADRPLSNPPSPQNTPQKENAPLGTTAPPEKAFHTDAPQAILYDMQTDTLLFEKEADQAIVPSSLTKVVLIYMLFERLSKGEVQLTDLFPVSEKAWRMGGSKMFVTLGSQISFGDLLQGAIVQSGNDACVVLTEGLAGSEEAFVSLMNQKAIALGAQNTHFLNSTGWPERGHTSTPRDLLLFGLRTIRDFPDLYARYYKQIEFIYNGIRQTNRNPLLYLNPGGGTVFDGIKTGHTDEGGYSLIGSGVRGDRRLIFVISGLKSVKQRATAAEQMVKYGFDHFEIVTLYPANTQVHQEPILGGSPTVVSLMTLAPITVTVRRGHKDMTTKKIQMSANLKLPIQKGQELGHLIVSSPGFSDKAFPLVASDDVQALGTFKKWWLFFQKAVSGFFS